MVTTRSKHSMTHQSPLPEVVTEKEAPKKKKTVRTKMPSSEELFANKDQEKKYFENTIYRSVTKGTWLAVDELCSMPVLKWLEDVGLDKYCTMNDEVYVDLVRYFYNNWEEEYTRNGIRIWTFVKGMKIFLDENVVRLALGFNDPAEGDEHLYARFFNLTENDEVGEWQYKRCFPLFAIDDKVGDLNPYVRILLKIVTTCIIPRTGCETVASNKDACILWHILMKKRIDMPYLIFHSMRSIARKGGRKALSYGMVITRILAQFMINVEGEKKLKCNATKNVIGTMRLNFMGYIFMNGKWVTKAPPHRELDSFPLLKGGSTPMNLENPLAMSNISNHSANLQTEAQVTSCSGKLKAVMEQVSGATDDTDSDTDSFSTGEANSVFGENKNVTIKDLKLLDRRNRVKIDMKFKKLAEQNKKHFAKLESMISEALSKK